ncbi:S41 family peptidase [Paenibacillus cremeus]|uniref:S41 family peptidase n=1 Tax=Paenibacillus cremeus TaxID=2163881 RepID=A0A559JIG0_9BACL|nr:S41 family peptidase [Paenibacillus cremeus]TVX99659.1 S41 family peptidase [Paenibacillus cremeus]
MKKLRPRRFWKQTATFALSLSLIIPAAAPVWAADAASTADKDAARTKEVMELLLENHVSAPSADKLAGKSIKEMLDSLNDPYTNYFTPEDLNSFTNAVENTYVGIGVRAEEDPSGMLVKEVFDGSSAKGAGIQAGDVVVAVQGESVAGLKLADIIAKVMGPEGTSVTLDVSHEGTVKPVTLKRQKVQIPTVISKYFSPGIGYLQITSFSSDADELATKQLAELKKNDMKSLIVDLRDNGGGYLDTALQLVKLFVKEGVLIHTRDRDNVDDPVKFTGGTTQPFQVYFLVNENSASASEVTTGALQDYGVITKVIGTKTFGKGSVQTVVPLQAGGALKVTIEEYLTPKLRKVNHVGIEPDIKVEGEVPQMITALRTAGMQDMDVTLEKKNVSIANVPVQNTFDIVRQEGKSYVPSRVLAAMTDETVTWNEPTHSIQFTTNSGSVAYTPSTSDFILKDGTSYVDMTKFTPTAPQLSWSDDGKKLVLHSQKQ